jgi:hypothetical protein
VFCRFWRYHGRGLGPGYGLPPPALQVRPQLLDLAAWTFGEHADRAHTDHDLAGRVDDGGNLDPTPGEADVNALRLPVSQRVTRRTYGQALA